MDKALVTETYLVERIVKNITIEKKESSIADCVKVIIAN